MAAPSSATWRHAEGVIDCDRGRLVGILNASPDSFSDPRGRLRLGALVERGHGLAAAGADVVEVGGQTLRDTAAISAQEEIERVVPVIAALKDEIGVPLAVDTFSPEVAREALASGAAILNDPTGLREPDMAQVAADAGAGVVLTHFLGPPKRVPALYPALDIVAAVVRWAQGALEHARAAGIGLDRVALDPGLGLGTSPFQDLDLLRRLSELSRFGRPIFLPISNKKVIGAVTGAPPSGRRAGTAAGVTWGYLNGARIFRVHDVAFMRDVLAMAEALSGEEPPAWHLVPG